MNLPKRKRIRMKGYNYSFAGSYFVTICTQDRMHYFGDVVNGKMALNELGKYCDQEIQDLSHRKTVNLNEWVVMPNHVHMVINIVGADQQSARLKNDQKTIRSIKGGLLNRPYEGPSLSSIVKLLKGNITKYGQNNDISFGWQRSFHDHIIRDQQSYDRIVDYIRNNPQKRTEDRFYK